MLESYNLARDYEFGNEKESLNLEVTCQIKVLYKLQFCTFKFSECALLVQIRSTTLDQMTLVLVGKSVQYENLKNPVPVIEFVTWSLTFSILS